jgi:tetratricopeptide (TPR) repeat protein
VGKRLDPIEAAVRRNDLLGARSLILRELPENPRSHWLLTRLSLTYYEQRNYRRALQIVQKALRLAPKCPLALWDYAGALQMLGRHREALSVYRRLVRRGVEAIANGECGEGRARACGLVADCHLRISRSLDALGQRRAALTALEKHLDLRGPGCRSIYPLEEAAERQERIRNGQPSV